MYERTYAWAREGGSLRSTINHGGLRYRLVGSTRRRTTTIWANAAPRRALPGAHAGNWYGQGPRATLRANEAYIIYERPEIFVNVLTNEMGDTEIVTLMSDAPYAFRRKRLYRERKNRGALNESAWALRGRTEYELRSEEKRFVHQPEELRARTNSFRFETSKLYTRRFDRSEYIILRMYPLHVILFGLPSCGRIMWLIDFSIKYVWI